MNKTIFIYALTCPDTGDVRYVGKADNPKHRFQTGHLGGRRSDFTPKGRWVKSLLELGKQPGMVILEECDEATWQKAERRWISHYRNITSDLLNVAGGGKKLSEADYAERNLSLTAAKRDALEQLAMDKGLSVNECIRQAIDLYLQLAN